MKDFKLFSLRSGLRTAGLALVLAGTALGPAAAAAPPEGSQAPAFSLPALDATRFSLTHARGHVVVVNFFATWCPPCRAETPDLNAAEKKYGAKGVIFVGVDDEENPALVSIFTRSKGVRYPIALDKDGAVARSYDVRAIPTTYVLDRDGVIRYRQVDRLDAPVLAAALDAVVAGAPVPESVASKNFRSTAVKATLKIQDGLRESKAITPQSAQPIDAAISAGVSANKKLDDLLSRPDANSISYFSIAEIRGRLNGSLADAYDARAALPGSKAASSDQTEAALLRGQILIDQERFAQAATQFDIALKLAPKDSRGYDGAYMSAYEQKDYAKAAEIARAQAELAPDEPESWLTVASSQNALKQYPAALEAERKALALASATYAKKPTSKSAAYELGRVWLKMSRTQIMAGDRAAARPLLMLASAAAPATIVAQQAQEQYAALETGNLAIERSGTQQANGASSHPAAVYVLVRNTSGLMRTVQMTASGLPPKWLVSFCYSTVCNPYKVSFSLPAGASKRIELLVAPLAQTNGPWSMSVNASGASTAQVYVEAKTAKAAITISAS